MMQRVLMACAVVVLVSFAAPAQDPAKVAGQQCKVAFQNDYVRVLHWTVGPHEKTPMHDHPPLVSVSLSDGRTRFTSADGKTRETENKAGQVTWSNTEKHSSESLGDGPAETIQVELKKKPDAAMVGSPGGKDSVTVDPKHYRVEFQNDRVRVLRIHYGPGEKSLMHAHPASVAVFLTDAHGKMTLPDGKADMVDWKRGQVQWSDKGTHLPENVGNRPFELVLVELK